MTAIRIGIDLGGTKIEGIALAGSEERFRHRVTTPRDYEGSLAAIVDLVAPTPFQRDVSDAHVRKLTHAMDKTKRYLDPVIRPGLVHRLDKKTSGLIVIAKDVRTHSIIARAFQKRQVRKRYTALVTGPIDANEGVIDAPIGRFADKKFWGVKEGGKDSMSRYRVVERARSGVILRGNGPGTTG